MSQVNFLVGGQNPFEIEPISTQHVEAARARQATLTKPAGSLGRLEDIACQLAGIQRKNQPAIKNKSTIADVRSRFNHLAEPSSSGPTNM